MVFAFGKMAQPSMVYEGREENNSEQVDAFHHKKRTPSLCINLLYTMPSSGRNMNQDELQLDSIEDFWNIDDIDWDDTLDVLDLVQEGTELGMFSDCIYDIFPEITESLLKEPDQVPNPPSVCSSEGRKRINMNYEHDSFYDLDSYRPQKGRGSLISDGGMISTTSVQPSSAELSCMSPSELDIQLQLSVSRLALSMQKSALSREQVLIIPDERKYHPSNAADFQQTRHVFTSYVQQIGSAL